MLVVILAAAIVAIVVVASGASSSPSPQPGGSEATSIEGGISALLAGIPQSGNTLGRVDAPLTLRWYGDLECPFCREFTLGALPSIIDTWVRDGQLKIEYLSMETATREPKVFEQQQIAALAAGMQGKMWNFIETFYHEQGEEDSGYVTERYLLGLASQVPGLNVGLWREDRRDQAPMLQVRAERRAARLARYLGTPTFLIGRTGGKAYRFRPPSLTDPSSFNRVIELLLQSS